MITNIDKELQKILDEDFLSINELSARIGISPQGIKKILSGQSKRIQRNTIRKIAEGTGRKFKIEGDKIYFYKPQPASNSEIESWRNTKLYQPITEPTAFDRKIINLGFSPSAARNLMYIPLLRVVPASTQNWEQVLERYQIETVLTVYEEGKDRLFAIRAPDDAMIDVIRQDAIAIVDPYSPLEDGRFAAIRFNDEKYTIRYFYDAGEFIILQSKNLPSEKYKKSEIEAYYRVVQLIQFV